MLSKLTLFLQGGEIPTAVWVPAAIAVAALLYWLLKRTFVAVKVFENHESFIQATPSAKTTLTARKTSRG